MKKSIGQNLLRILYSIVFGALAGVVIWAFIRIMSEGMFFIWNWIPSKVRLPLYPLIVCVIGGAIIGVFRKKFGDYPEELMTIIGKVKTDKNYDYKKLPVIFVAALLPIIIGSSVGPEAGLVGIIVAISYFIKARLKVIEDNPKKVVKIILYMLSLVSAIAVLCTFNYFFVKEMSGFPSVKSGFPKLKDLLMLFIYIPAGLILGIFYEVTHKGCHKISGKVPPILKEVIAGACLGIFGCLLPVLMFSGEEELGELFAHPDRFAPLVLIALAFFKVLLTNICIQFGLKGGHFFPLIFAGACLGYGIAAIAFPESASHVAFAAAVVTGTTLGYTMKKPIIIALILMLCYPIGLAPWILAVAFVGSKIGKVVHEKTMRL